MTHEENAPLTLDEVKQLQPGEWVWVESECADLRGYYRFLNIIDTFEDKLFANFYVLEDLLQLNEYGDTWRVYRRQPTEVKDD